MPLRLLSSPAHALSLFAHRVRLHRSLLSTHVNHHTKLQISDSARRSFPGRPPPRAFGPTLPILRGSFEPPFGTRGKGRFLQSDFPWTIVFPFSPFLPFLIVYIFIFFEMCGMVFSPPLIPNLSEVKRSPLPPSSPAFPSEDENSAIVSRF